MERGQLRAIAVLRVVAYLLLVTVVVGQHARADHPAVAWSLLIVAGATTAIISLLAILNPSQLVRTPIVLAELVVGATLLLADGAVFAHGHVGSAQGGLAGSWPIAGILSAGIAFGPWVGLGAGAALGVAHSMAVPLNGESFYSIDITHRLALLSSLVLFSLYGAAAGFATRFTRRYDDVLANARAREDVARTLHDGVLQTLAIFARRSSDPQLASLAREQDRELRSFIANDAASAGFLRSSRRHDRAWLDAALRACASRHVDSGTLITISVARDLRSLSTSKAEALLGAASEAIANSAKHSRAHQITVFIEPSGRGVFCAVKDDGVGFDERDVTVGTGLKRSIRERMSAVGGRCDVISEPGRGTEVKLWL